MTHSMCLSNAVPEIESVYHGRGSGYSDMLAGVASVAALREARNLRHIERAGPRYEIYEAIDDIFWVMFLSGSLIDNA